MVRIIKTFEELWVYQKEVRNRQHEVNPVTLEFINESFTHNLGAYDWTKEYIKVTRINNHETIEHVRQCNLILQYLRYVHIFNYYGIPEEDIYL